MPNHLPPPKSPCGHKLYRLNCDDYDRLVAHADGRCQICKALPEETGHGYLVVDHDAQVGQWAVRGLLCSDCNSALPCGTRPSWALAYLDRPWWRLELEAQGLSPEVLPEPPPGSRVAAGSNIHWVRTEQGWEHTARYRNATPKTWSALNRKYGPHQIRVVRMGLLTRDEVYGTDKETTA